MTAIVRDKFQGDDVEDAMMRAIVDLIESDDHDKVKQKREHTDRFASRYRCQFHRIGLPNHNHIVEIFSFSGDTGEIKNEVREQINKKMTEWRQENKAQIVPGVIFIDEVHILDLECFSFLNRMIESDLAPILVCRGFLFLFMPTHFSSTQVMATIKGKVNIRGTTLKSPHSIPIDLLDRCLIIRTQKYADNEINEILITRAKDENVEVEDDAFEILQKISKESSLRYAIQLISVADVAHRYVFSLFFFCCNKVCVGYGLCVTIGYLYRKPEVRWDNTRWGITYNTTQ